VRGLGRTAIAIALASSCVNDAARVACPNGLSYCGETCIDTSFDPAHCGACDITCPSGELCSLSQCSTECLGGTRQCGTRCVDTQNDPAHCGACDAACASGQVCVSGSCATLCDNGLVNCSGDCVDVQIDPEHCGGCDEPCGPGAACVSAACEYAASCAEIAARAPGSPSGVYTIDVDGDGPEDAFDVHCDMTTNDGGWTLVLNLDTSDGHVMWWADPLWSDAETHGSASEALTADHKSNAWNLLGDATEILVLIHQEGSTHGWKSFSKAAGTMRAHLTSGDNTLIGIAVLAEDTAALWDGERLVRLSTQLFANHCITNNGGCVSGGTGSPDGDRIGSHEATPGDNVGGGLGNWHDMNYCCTGQTYGSGKTCNGSAFRTTSEAQAGWSPCYMGAGYFGSDSFAPATNSCTESPCRNANYSAPSGMDYDYAIYLR